MKNVTISLSEPVATFARVLAARKNLSVSRFISGLLEDLMKKDSRRDHALEEFLAQEPYLETKGRTYKRDEIYDRKVLR